MKVNIPFNQLLALINQLSPTQKQKIRKELEASAAPQKNSRLRELALNGPTLTEDQIKTMEETRKSINEWRTK